MIDILVAYRKALRSLLMPGVFWHLCWPALVAAIVWAGLLWFCWGPATEALHAMLLSALGLGAWLRGGWTDVALVAALKLFLLAISVLLMFFLTLLLVALVALPLILDRVASKEYADIELRRGGSLAGSAFNALKALILFCVALFVCLPILLIPGMGVMTLILLSGWFNVRCFRYDALMNHADAIELRDLPKRHSWSLAAIGIAGSALGIVPMLNLLVPIISGLAFTHYLLDALRHQRMQVGGCS